MIISDEDDTQKIKDPPVSIPTVRYPEPAASRPHLPDYETSQALAFRDRDESQVTLYKPPPRRRILDSRFWRAALISLVVYIFLTLVIGVPIIVHKEYEDQQKYPLNELTYVLWPNKSTAYHPGGTNNSSSLQGGVVPICANWTDIQYRESGDGNDTIVLAVAENYVSPNGQFSISSNASSSSDLNLVQGAMFTGINPNESVRDAVLSIVMQSSSSGIFNRTSVCWAVADNFTDLGLYFPDNLTLTDNILYNITLLFPRTGTPSRVDTFSTFLPMSEQRFGSFDGNVNFDRVTIEGPVSRINADYLQANMLLVDTSLERIVGTFQAHASLLISTIMAPIIANISLYNDPKSPVPTFLDIHTGNSNLTTNITLLAPNLSPPPRPNFVASLRTFSGSLSTNVAHDANSPPTVLQLNVINDLGPVSVTLDSLYEGIFQVDTKQAFATVTQGNASLPDPWIPGATRTMVMDMNSTMRSYGWVGWGAEGTPLNAYQQGEVVVDSSLANVTLTFLG